MNDTDASDTDLEGVLRAHGTNYGDASLALIYKHVSHKDQTQVLANGPLPVSLLIYAIHAIFEPRLVFQQIPRLLDLLAQMELIRRKAIHHARSALIWQHWYMQQPITEREDFVLLTKREESRLTQMSEEAKDHSARTVYRIIVDTCIRLHLTHLWTSRADAHLLPLYLRIYFPLFSPVGAETSPLLFHKIMSKEDGEKHDESITDCVEFMKSAKDWEEAQLTKKAEIDAEDYEDAAFQALVDNYTKHKSPEFLLRSTTIYIDKIKSRVDLLESIFS